MEPYEPYTWSKGERLRAAGVNRIEQGLSDVTKAVIEMDVDEPDSFISDAVTEWWCHPVATYLESPYPRTVSGAISSTGRVIAAEFNHGTGKTRRYEVGSAAVDDHSVPALWAKAGHRFVFAYTNHNRDNSINIRVSNRDGDLGSLAEGPAATFDLGALASYTQIHRITSLSDDIQDTFWIVTRRGNTTWAIARISVDQATGKVTKGAVTVIVSAPNRQCYVTTADSNSSSGDQILRFSWGYNPAQPVHAIYYIEINTRTGAISSPFDTSLAANVDGTNLPILDTALKPMIAEPESGTSRRLFYTRPGPDKPAVAYAEGPVDLPDEWVYFVQEIVPSGLRDPYGGLAVNTGYAAAAYRPEMTQPNGFEYQAILTLPATAAVTEFGRSYISGTAAGFFLRLNAEGKPTFTTYLSGGVPLQWTAQSAIPGFAWGKDLGLQLRVNPGSAVATIYYSLDRGETWQSNDDMRASFGTVGTLAAWSQPLAVPSTSTTLAKATNVRYAHLKSLEGVVIAQINFRKDWSGSGTFTDEAGSTWSLNGGAAIAPADTQEQGGRLGERFAFGTSGPRVGYTAAANYVAGMAFENPSRSRVVIVARQEYGFERVQRYRPARNGGYDSGEQLASGSYDGRYVRPYPPINGGPIPAIFTRMTKYADDNYTDYQGSIRTT